jgi:SAM-dependent methyltransferase
VLDVGCGGSTSIPEPFIPYGIEISRELHGRVAAKMAARGGEAIHAPAADGMAYFPDGYFTGIIMRSVAEHEVRPKLLFRHAARVLSGDGAVYVRVPNFACLNRTIMGSKWSGIRHPDHVNYFTHSSLRQMSAECGFRLRILRPLLLPFNDNVNAVLTKV